MKAVEDSTSALADLFEREGTRFFTENDVGCCLHRLLHDNLAGLG